MQATPNKKKKTETDTGVAIHGILQLCCCFPDYHPLFILDVLPHPLPPPSPVPQERVRSNHQRIARAVAKIDEQFQQQMDQASATLEGVDRADSTLGGGLPHASTVSTTGADDNRDLAIMVASDSAKVSTS